MLWESPAQLFGNLKSIGFRAFCIIWTEVDIDECPPVFVGNLAAEAIHIIIIATNTNRARTVDGRTNDFPLL